MTPTENTLDRLAFLARLVQREYDHLALTDQRLFFHPFTAERARTLADDIDEAERVEAFVGRFGRLQDTLGDKLIPAYLGALGEQPRPVMDTLDRAERLGIIPDSTNWMAMRQLRNQMVHEYIEDAVVLASALQSGHEFVPVLGQTMRNCLDDLRRRGWLTS